MKKNQSSKCPSPEYVVAATRPLVTKSSAFIVKVKMSSVRNTRVLPGMTETFYVPDVGLP